MITGAFMSRSQFREKKSDIPQVTAEYLSEIISAYHAKKSYDTKFHIKMPTSPTMHLLQQFYNQLDKNTDILSPKEVFDLCKILFTNNKRNGETTKLVINAILLSFFDPQVTAVLDHTVARFGNIDALADSFAKICKNPEETAMSEMKKSQLPQIKVSDLSEIVDHAVVDKSMGNWFLGMKKISPTMNQLTSFYLANMTKTSPLSPKEIFELCKILFADPQRDGPSTKLTINNFLLKFFDPRVTAALDSATIKVGKIDALADYFEIICQNPDIAASITYSVLLLDHVVNHPLVAEAKTSPDLFCRKLLNEIKADPQYGVDILNVNRIIYDPTHSEVIRGSVFDAKNIDDILKADAVSYISLKLYQYDLFDFEKIKKLRLCPYQELIDLAKKIDVVSDPKKLINDYLSGYTYSLNRMTPVYISPCYRELKAETPPVNEEKVHSAPGLR